MGREVTMQEVLDFREEKAGIQAKMHRNNPDGIVVSFGMNIAGPIKSGSTILLGFREGEKEIETTIETIGGTLVEKQTLEGVAGYAAFYVVTKLERMQLKKALVLLEENHQLGRLWDIDVLKENMEPISRVEIGATRRKCLLCEQDAKVCGRSRAHTVAELQEKVETMIKSWEKV